MSLLGSFLQADCFKTLKGKIDESLPFNDGENRRNHRFPAVEMEWSLHESLCHFQYQNLDSPVKEVFLLCTMKSPYYSKLW